MADAGVPQPIYLKDYKAPDYLIDEVDLDVRLDPAATQVVTRLKVRRNPAAADAPPMVLNGEDLELVEVRLDGEPLGANRYSVDDAHLTLAEPPAAFTLEVTSRTRPEANTKLEGLYLSNRIYCTQCEPEGFRRIAYYPDRPDVMATYRTRIEAERAHCPVLLSNGNLVDSGDLENGRHFAVWHDPFPKPSYLFALVAGDLARIEDHFVTRSGRDVLLEIYADAKDIDKCDHAMVSLKKSMQWDEDRFGLEYDLDRFMIVAVGDFNYGAMENKGLNIFNTKYVLAKPETATDADYLGIESVVAHEYFHNWTGDRVTCRDWFQLSLKEGLTVFRDQEFSSDLHSRAVKRIADVRRLRASQFIEDGGPLAHPIRPESYVEIGNFYTATVYEKGAEVIRMLHTLIGEDAFQRGMQIYFERHDGQAVTCEDFVAAMEAGSGYDLAQFRRWYSQAGTPKLTVRGRYDPSAKTYTMAVRQEVPDTPGQSGKSPMPIPLAMGLLGTDGADLPLRLAGEDHATSGTRVLQVIDAEQTFTFEDVPAAPVASLLRGFSAPVILDAGQDEAQLRFLMAHDSDPFVRWEAGNTYATKLMLALVGKRAAGEPLTLDPGLADAFAATLADESLERAFLAQALSLPAESFVGEQMAVIDVDGIHAVRQYLRQALGAKLHAQWRATYERYQTATYSIEAEAMGARTLKNLALGYRVAGGSAAGACVDQFAAAHNMTDQFAALEILAASDLPERAEALENFYARWKDDALVVDKWFALQARTQRSDSLEQVEALVGHEAFTLKNPNRARSLIGGFAAGNPTGFHRADGAGYAFVADQVMALEKLNPSVAARMTTVFGRWRRYDTCRQDLMKAQLERILATPKLSRDTYEIASKSLG